MPKIIQMAGGMRQSFMEMFQKEALLITAQQLAQTLH